MSKFNLGDKVYYIERDWYIEEAVVHYANEHTRNCFDKLHQPFEILSVKHIKTKGIWDKEITEKIVYDLYCIDHNNVDMREDIDEEDVFASLEECGEMAAVITKNTRWR